LDDEAGDLVRVTNPAQTLTSLLSLTSSPADSSVQYVIGGVRMTPMDIEAAAQILSDDAMRLRCGDSPVLASWRARRDGGPPHEGTRAQAVAVFAGIGFGLPGSPANEDHLQGHVAELVWWRLVRERKVCEDGRTLVHVSALKADTLEPGGDGLVVYSIEGHVLVFRLWEIKKHDSDSHVSATIGRASRQLARRGKEYLAKLAGPETSRQGPLGELFADMVELWLDNSDRAGVGVSIGTSASHAPSNPRAFGSVTTAFPKLSSPGQTEAIVVAVPDYKAFAERVREIVWTGL
jgi:hypothetical protein